MHNSAAEMARQYGIDPMPLRIMRRTEKLSWHERHTRWNPLGGTGMIR